MQNIFILEPSGKTNTAKYVGNITQGDTTIFTSSDNHYPEGRSIPVFGNYNKSGSLKKLIYYIIGWLKILPRVKRNQIFHYHWLKLSILDALFLILLKIKGVVVIGTVHNILPHESLFWDKFFFRIVYKISNHLVFHTKGILSDFTHTLFHPQKFSIIQHYFDQVDIDSSMEDRSQLLFFGNIRPYKGLELLIDAMDKVTDEKARLVVAGKPEYDIENITSAQNDKIDWRLGYVENSEVTKLFNSSGIVVLPYLKIDTSGLFYLAKSFGKIIIAPDMGIFSELIQDKYDGLLFTPNDSSDLADKISYLLEEINFRQLKKNVMDSRPDDSVSEFRNAHKNLYATYL